MNAEMKTKWLEALRSGKYKQASGALRKTFHEFLDSPSYEGYCCLGVLCDISDAGTWESFGVADVAAFSLPASAERTNPCWLRSATDLPEYLREDLAISTASERTLINLNDEEEASFNAIADWIEANL